MLKLIYRDWHNLLHPDFIGEPELILDCGFGTGNWAYDLAEYDPDCTVSALHAISRTTMLTCSGDRCRHLSTHGAARPAGKHGSSGTLSHVIRPAVQFDGTDRSSLRDSFEPFFTYAFAGDAAEEDGPVDRLADELPDRKSQRSSGLRRTGDLQPYTLSLRSRRHRILSLAKLFPRHVSVGAPVE